MWTESARIFRELYFFTSPKRRRRRKKNETNINNELIFVFTKKLNSRCFRRVEEVLRINVQQKLSKAFTWVYYPSKAVKVTVCDLYFSKHYTRLYSPFVLRFILAREKAHRTLVLDLPQFEFFFLHCTESNGHDLLESHHKSTSNGCGPMFFLYTRRFQRYFPRKWQHHSPWSMAPFDRLS